MLITSEFGIIKSRDYPNFRQEMNPCEIKIQVPVGKTVDIWVIDMAINIKEYLFSLVYTFIS